MSNDDQQTDRYGIFANIEGDTVMSDGTRVLVQPVTRGDGYERLRVTGVSPGDNRHHIHKIVDGEKLRDFRIKWIEPRFIEGLRKHQPDVMLDYFTAPTRREAEEKLDKLRHLRQLPD